MPLQNRVTPAGEIIVDPACGLFMGNRGGRFHDPDTKQVHPTRRWASRQWICCVTEFKDRKRELMGHSYTELFFLDEVTALAAGHRPCFECRRADANDFGDHWGKIAGQDNRPMVAEMDKLLHKERLEKKTKATHEADWQDLPDGAVVQHQDVIFAKRGENALRWFPGGYERWSNLHFQGSVSCLTPPTIIAILKSGYSPVWHPSAQVQ